MEIVKEEKQNNYQKYYKNKRESDPEYKAKYNAYIYKYRNKRMKEDMEFRKTEFDRTKMKLKKKYHNDPEYAERKRESARVRYYENKIMDMYRKLFDT